MRVGYANENDEVTKCSIKKFESVNYLHNLCRYMHVL